MRREGEHARGDVQESVAYSKTEIFSGGSWCLVYDSSGLKPFVSQEASVLIFFFQIKNNFCCSHYKDNAEDSENVDKQKKDAQIPTFER